MNDEYVTREYFHRTLDEIYERIELMASQSDVDAITAQVTQVATDLATASSTLQAELDKLAAANPSVDLTALQAAVAPLDPAVQALDALVPEATPPTSS